MSKTNPPLQGEQQKTKPRKALSRRIPRMGRVVFSGGASSVQCAVRNFSPQGAVVIMSGWLGLPSGFTLFVEPDSIRAECRIIRRRGNNIEVEFLSVEENVRYRSSVEDTVERANLF